MKWMSSEKVADCDKVIYAKVIFFLRLIASPYIFFCGRNLVNSSPLPNIQDSDGFLDL